MSTIMNATNQNDNKRSSVFKSEGTEIVVNKKYFLEKIRVEKYRAQRSGSALSLLLISPESSRQKNLEGRVEVLKAVQTRMRETDLACYFDKRTLGILLPYTDNKGAEKLSQKIIKSVDNLKLSAVTATYPDNVFENLVNKVTADTVALGLMIENRDHSSGVRRHIKRGIDIVGSLSALIILGPLMIVTAALVKLSSPGPVIFKQNRIGYKGAPFTFYKFRSMRTGASDQIHRDFVLKHIQGDDSTLNNGDENKPLYKIKVDPRVTRVGRIIRKTSIDELPQLINVLLGDMSLVGPRPPLPYEAEKYQTWQLRRILDMKPGITGLWQVEGRGRTLFDEAVRLDICYIETWSIRLDIKILFQTVDAVLRCKGAV